jgi:primosomal protein N' (replication factor Y)
VTGSGKTEIYKNLAKKHSLDCNDGQTILLLPENALTPQLLAEFRGIFGDKMAVWHSKLSVGEKIQEWARCVFGEAKILIGARSAAFVPLQNPKLIILDEEHEWTFKSEFSPRIWTHDLAEKIAEKFSAKLVFGSATPRVESLVKCENNEWDLVTLDKRVTEVQMPEISFIDLKNEAKKGNYGPISEKLAEEIQKILAKKKQGILFLNRRGFFGSTTCKKCGTTMECPDCSFPMKVHRNPAKEILLCHVCGFMKNFPQTCPECGEKDFEFRGWGTQQLEEILKTQFPKLRVLRADADSTRRKNGFREIMEKFHNGEADILLGTQMIAKGLDFENVDLVGVILADIGLSLPDFRAEERVYQLLTQVAGRAGRRKNRGKILIQTFRPDEELFKFVKKHDTANFLQWQKSHREQMQMPPFISLAKITFSRREKQKAFQLAKNFAGFCQGKLGKEKVDWAPAFFPRSHNQYHFHVFIRLNSREKLIKFLHETEIPKPAKIDIMPVSLL